MFNEDSAAGNIVILISIQAIFVALKLFKLVTWSWFEIFIPIMILVGAIMIAMIAVVLNWIINR